MKSITTGIVRLTRMSIFPGKGNAEASPLKRHKASLLLPKSDSLTWRKINDAIAEAIGVGLKNKWCGIYLEHIKMPILDGDKIYADRPIGNAHCQGHYLIMASSKNQPDIVDTALQAVTDPDEIYDGIYAHASLKFVPNEIAGIPGINCYLGPIMKVADGEFIPRRISPEQAAFGDIVGVKAKHSPPRSEAKAATIPVANEFEIDAENPPWTSEDFDDLGETMKKRTFTLEEFKELAGGKEAE